MKTDPKTIQARSLSEPDAEVLATVLIEDEDEIRGCPLWPCSGCRYIQTCMN